MGKGGKRHDHAILLTGLDICSWKNEPCDTLGKTVHRLQAHKPNCLLFIQIKTAVDSMLYNETVVWDGGAVSSDDNLELSAWHKCCHFGLVGSERWCWGCSHYNRGEGSLTGASRRNFKWRNYFLLWTTATFSWRSTARSVTIPLVNCHFEGKELIKNESCHGCLSNLCEECVKGAVLQEWMSLSSVYAWILGLLTGKATGTTSM